MIFIIFKKNFIVKNINTININKNSKPYISNDNSIAKSVSLLLILFNKQVISTLAVSPTLASL